MISSKRVHLLMCEPSNFEVSYEINLWMNRSNKADKLQSNSQWQNLVNTYRNLGFTIDIMQSDPSVPDLVFTANGGMVVDDRVMLPRFRHPERQLETKFDKDWFDAHKSELGITAIKLPINTYEGEGDCLMANGKLFTGYGFRTSLESHQEVAEFFDREVVSLKLVDPRFYHLDTAMSIIDSNTCIFFPDAFDDESKIKIVTNFETSIEASEADAVVFGLNMLSDGQNVILSNRATGIIRELDSRGYTTHPVAIHEFLKGGGGIKCLSLFLKQVH